MCNKPALNEITTKVYLAARDVLGNKLERVVLFGSRARGDYDDESDVDIMILADIQPDTADKTRDKIRALTGDLGLEYDVVVCLHMVCSTIFHRFVSVMPYYKNIVKDGVEVYA